MLELREWLHQNNCSRILSKFYHLLYLLNKLVVVFPLVLVQKYFKKQDLPRIALDKRYFYQILCSEQVKKIIRLFCLNFCCLCKVLLFSIPCLVREWLTIFGCKFLHYISCFVFLSFSKKPAWRFRCKPVNKFM